MTPQLRAMLVVAGVVVLGGVSLYLYTPQPSTRTMAELRAAGIANGQKLVLSCPERLTAQTRRRINKVQPGFLRPKQAYAQVARVAECFNPDGGNCFSPAGAARITDGEGIIVVPSLRHDLAGIDLDAGDTVDDAGESTEVDDALQYNPDECVFYRCQDYDAGSLFANPVCNTLNRVWAENPPCVIPNCWTLPDGGWKDDAVVDCRATGPWGLEDGGPRWSGCNVLHQAVGTACLPSACSVVAGDNPPDWL